MPVELLGRSAFPPIGDLPYFITLPGYGFYWFLLAEEAEAPNWHEPYVTPLPEFRTLVLGRGWSSIIEANNGAVLWQSNPAGFPAEPALVRRQRAAASSRCRWPMRPNTRRRVPTS